MIDTFFKFRKGISISAIAVGSFTGPGDLRTKYLSTFSGCVIILIESVIFCPSTTREAYVLDHLFLPGDHRLMCFVHCWIFQDAMKRKPFYEIRNIIIIMTDNRYLYNITNCIFGVCCKCLKIYLKCYKYTGCRIEMWHF